MKHVAAIMASTLVLGACGGGGGGGSDNPRPTPEPVVSAPKMEGAYEGTTNLNQLVDVLALEDDSVWAIYGSSDGIPQGFVQASGASDGRG